MAGGSFSRWRRPLQPGPDRRRPEIETDDSIGRPSPRYNLMPVDVLVFCGLILYEQLFLDPKYQISQASHLHILSLDEIEQDKE
jgi:hypothetical protein